MKESAYHILPDWWKQFTKQRRVRWISLWLLLVLVLSLFSGFLANDLPLTCTLQGQRLYPAFQPDKVILIVDTSGDTIRQPIRLVNWEQQDLEDVWMPLIPYGNSANPAQKARSPLGSQPQSGRKRHWLGTDGSGHDILAGLLNGGRVTLGVGFFATLITGLIGFLIGSIAGYFGDDRLRVPPGFLWVAVPGLALGIWMGFVRKAIVFEQTSGWEWWGEWLAGLLVLVLVLAVMMVPAWWWIWRKSKTWKPMRLDFWLSRVIEVLDSLPQLLLLIAIGAVLSRDVTTFVLLIGFTSWSGVARLVRAESLRIRNADYLTAARVSGIPARRILTRHVWPQVLPPLLVPLAFGVGNAIIAESSLSFLHIIQDSESWGSMLSSAIHDRNYWWVPLFPGLAIFSVVLSVNILGESMRKAMGLGKRGIREGIEDIEV